MTDGCVVDDEDMPDGEADREPDPSDSLRTFGEVMQALREHAGYSRTEFADLVRFSKHTVESVELGRRMPDVALVERSEEALGNTGALRKSSKYVTRGRGDVGLAAWFRQWARLERVAVSLCTYECRLVPGLLQSEGYARALFENRIPLLTDEQLEAQVAARLDRQRMLLERPTVPFHFIVEEAVFRRRLGGRDVQRRQLDYVLERTAPRNVTLQVMPLDAEFHACMDGPVRLLETSKGRRLAYSEGQENGRLISDSKRGEPPLPALRHTALAGPELQGLPGSAGATPRRAMSATELAWFKSSYSGSSGDDCVEVAVTGQAVCVRDSKNVTRPYFAVGREEWSRFVGFVTEV